jgi:hypothetical protein
LRHHFASFLLAVSSHQVVFNPGHEMVLERTLDKLMEQIGRKNLVDIGTGEVMCEWLALCELKRESQLGGLGHTFIAAM